jgi:cell shape-determining protein MreC
MIRIILPVFLLGVLIFGGFLVTPKLFFPSLDSRRELRELRIENENLRAEILQIKLGVNPEKRYQSVKVYSAYPFNNRSELTLAAGENAGLKEGMTVTVGGRLLLGRIIKTSAQYSIVRTIFDSGWEIPARIGEAGVDALLIGGQSPVLTLINKNKPIKSGETVYSAGRRFPYGLIIGKIDALFGEEPDLFQRASLTMPYELNNIQEVAVITTNGNWEMGIRN